MQGQPDSDVTAALLDRTRGGEREAFGLLFARHRKVLRRVIDLRLERELRGRVDPSDVLQETQVDAYGRLDDYLRRRPMPFALWLRKTACERLIKLREQHREAARRSVEREVPLPDQTSLVLFQKLCATSNIPERRIARQELARKVRFALARLSDADREILLMRYLEDLSNGEIAQVLGLEPAAVAKRHGRALLRLEQALREDEVGESDLR
jgi:RNA polymerase sigma-70 factor (ECF subfamily)